MNAQEIQAIMSEKCPCDKCDQSSICKEEELACGTFAKYVLNGRYDITSAKTPTVRVFKKIFEKDTFNYKDLEEEQ